MLINDDMNINLANKWRPKEFKDVIGHDVIVNILKNAIKSDNIANAYLFVGPCSTGKTTLARIFAMSINCNNKTNSEPCNKCKSCKNILNDSCADVVEIDGASNNSVESIRKLIEEVSFFPVESKYKIYIIDEAHMLSNAAWNAFLKTLEEPPSYVKFIFATTDISKILPTVISRCQRLNLNKIKKNDILQRLIKISEYEKININEDALKVIIDISDYKIRESLLILDYIVGSLNINYKEIIDKSYIYNLYGIIENESLILILKYILEKKYKDLLCEINKIIDSGKNLRNLFNQIILELRNIELIMLTKNPQSILDIDDSIILEYKKLSKFTSLKFLNKIIDFLTSKDKIGYDYLDNKDVFISTILRSINYATSKDLEDIITELKSLIKKI